MKERGRDDREGERGWEKEKGGGGGGGREGGRGG